MRRVVIGVALVPLLVSGCALWSKPSRPPQRPVTRSERPVVPQPQPAAPPPAAAAPALAPEPPRVPTPKVEAERDEPRRDGPTQPPTPGKMMALRFEAVDLEAVLRVLSEAAGVNYVLAQGVKVQVTMNIDRFPASEALAIMEAVLEANNLVAIKAGSIYKIVPTAAAAQQPTPIGLGKDLAVEDGFLTQIVALQHLSADELAKVLQPLMGAGKVTAYRETNSLVLSGPASLIKRLLQTVEALDLPGKQREAPQIYVYYVANAKAKELASVIAALFGDKAAAAPLPAGAPAPPRPPVSPPAALPSPAPPSPPRPGLSAVPPPGATPEVPATPVEEVAKAVGEIRVVADERTNSLIIRATAQDYALIEATIKKLDFTPKQVLIEVFVAEVTLNDTLNFGVEQFLKVGGFTFLQAFGLGPGPAALLQGVAKNIPGVATNIPGFTMSFVDAPSFMLFLNTLDQYTKIQTLAAPHILTQDNKPAKIQVGQEVPIVTGTQSTLTAVAQQGQNVFQTLQQRDVGRILTIRPHVNEDRQVSLDIHLELSDVISLQTGSIGSPTFSKRTAETTVVVEDHQSLLIGGIISTQKGQRSSGIPLLSQIPVIGRLFRSTTEFEDKTELLMLLTPHVIASPEEGKALTEAFRKRLESLGKTLERPR